MLKIYNKRTMGVDFDIIDVSGNLVDRYSIKWLDREWDKNFCFIYSHSTINKIIDYCDEEINKLKNKLNKVKIIINCWEETDFEKRKKMKIDLISSIDNEKEFYSTLEYFSEFIINKYDDDNEFEIKLRNNSKLIADYDNYLLYMDCFIHFKDFLLKYKEYKYEISY